MLKEQRRRPKRSTSMVCVAGPSLLTMITDSIRSPSLLLPRTKFKHAFVVLPQTRCTSPPHHIHLQIRLKRPCHLPGFQLSSMHTCYTNTVQDPQRALRGQALAILRPSRSLSRQLELARPDASQALRHRANRFSTSCTTSIGDSSVTFAVQKIQQCILDLRLLYGHRPEGLSWIWTAERNASIR